jgi:hypothetical protein
MPTKKTDKPMWDKVWVISGEPCMSRLSLQALLEDNGIKNTKRFYKDSDLKSLHSTLTTFSLKQNQAIIINDPNAAMLRICLDLIESGCITVKMLIVFIVGDNIDGRMAFFTRAAKNKRVINLPYIMAKDSISLIKHLKNWELGAEIKLSSEATKWLVDNAPIEIAKIKDKTGKKDTEVYDLVWMESELDKIAILCKKENRNMEVNDLVTFCDFTQVIDIWDFIKCTIDGNFKQSHNLIYKLLNDQPLNSVLWLLYSQLIFLIQLKQLVDIYGTDTNVLMSKMNYKEYLNKYFNDNWEEVTEITEPTINFWRIKKAVESMTNWELDNIVKQYNAVTNAILDLRSSGKEDIVIAYLLLAMSQQTEPKLLYAA